jgi:hypothetical protein
MAALDARGSSDVSNAYMNSGGVGLVEWWILKNCVRSGFPRVTIVAGIAEKNQYAV